MSLSEMWLVLVLVCGWGIGTLAAILGARTWWAYVWFGPEGVRRLWATWGRFLARLARCVSLHPRLWWCTAYLVWLDWRVLRSMWREDTLGRRSGREWRGDTAAETRLHEASVALVYKYNRMLKIRRELYTK